MTVRSTDLPPPDERLVPRIALLVSLLVLGGCPPPETRAGNKPEGTPTDPVEVCEQSGDVCRYEGSKLGVCNSAASGTNGCPSAGPCFVCVSQH
jgi:hypothetical protein